MRFLPPALLAIVTSGGLAAAMAAHAASSQARDASGEWRCDRTPLAVTNATIWLDDGGEAKRDILIENGTITDIGAPGHVTRPPGARVVDAGGAIVLPGLIDSHAHFVWPAPLAAGAAQPGEAAATTARQTLASGVTSVRVHLSTLNESATLPQAAADPCFPGPRVALGGPGLTGGRPDLQAPVMRGVRDAADARQKVREVAAARAGWLALHDTHRFAPEELEAIVSEAKTAGLALMGAADGFDEARASVLAGVSTLEYLNRTTAPAYPDDLMELLRARRETTWVVPPIGFYTRYTAYRGNPVRVRETIHTRLMRPAVAASLLDSAERLFREAAPSSTDLSFATLGPKFRQLRAAGLRMVLGTDSGSHGQFHADAIWHEMRAWRDLGVPPREIVRAGTAVPAGMPGHDSVGVLREGAPGDLIVYRGRLAAGELDVGAVTHVIKGGVMFVRDGEWVGPPADPALGRKAASITSSGDSRPSSTAATTRRRPASER